MEVKLLPNRHDGRRRSTGILRFDAPRIFGIVSVAHNPLPARAKTRHPSDASGPFYKVQWLEHLQWPAMAAALLSAWLVAAQSKAKRQWGFWVFLLSNVLWVAWGWHDQAWALVLLQIGLAVLNIRGVAKNERS